MTLNLSAVRRSPPAPRRAAQSAAFWMVAYAFAVVMAFSAVPTPLYVIYAQRDHFGDLTSTLIYAAYAIGVVASLFFLGHISDWVGRRRMLLLAVPLSLAAGIVFLLSTTVPALVAARVISGVAVGVVTSTATAHLRELDLLRADRSARRVDLVSVGANLGGIGIGPLLAGLLAQFAPRPLLVPYLVFEGLLLVAVGALVLVPETADVREIRYRPQRVTVPRAARARFLAAAVIGLVTFAVFGLFNSLAPAFLSGTLHEPSHAAAGAVAFAVFAAAAVAQAALRRASIRRSLTAGAATTAIGLALLSWSSVSPSLPIFVIGGIVTGAGAGLSFKGSLLTVLEVSPVRSRAESLAGFFLAGYIGLSVPIVVLGFVGGHVSTALEMSGFAGVVVVALVAATLALVALTRRSAARVPPANGSLPSTTDQPAA